jgi:hypothetical protein
MKVKKLVTVLVLTLVLGLSATAYAATTQGTTVRQRLGLNRITSMRGYDYVVSVLKNKLGLTDKNITDGLNSGKTLYDLAKDKGMTLEQYKDAVYEEKAKAIDAAVSKGTITKQQGEDLKAALKSNIDNCTAPGQMSGRGAGNCGGMMGRGRGNGGCYLNGTVNSTK